MNNYTLLGIIAVIIWGLALPLVRIVQDQIGAVTFLGLSFFLIGIFNILFNKFKINFRRDVFGHPVLYLRWFFFVLHESLILISIGIVTKQNIPIVILINYLWPTFVILFSIIIAELRIYKLFFFYLGTIIVISSLSFELLFDSGVDKNILNNATDKLAYFLSFIGAISWGLYSSLSRKFGLKTGSSAPIPLFQLTLALALPISLLPQIRSHFSITILGIVLLVCISLAQVFAYNAWNKGIQFGNIVIISLCADLIPWISLTGTSIILDVGIETKTIISAIFLVIGATITRYGTIRSASE